MILRYDKVGAKLPPPSDVDPAGATIAEIATRLRQDVGCGDPPLGVVA